MAFIVIRDGHGFIQTVFNAKCMSCLDASKLNRETAVLVQGLIKKEEKSPTNGFELDADYWQLVGAADGDFETLVQPDSGPDVRAH